MKKLFILLTSLLSAGSMMGADYVKVTSAPTDWSGEYVLVSQDKDGKDHVFNGLDAVGCSTVSIENKTISNYDGITISIVPVGDAYAVRVNGGDNNGKFLSSGSSAPSYANALKFVTDSTKHIVNLAMDGENTILSQTTADGDVSIRFNYAVDQLRFRFYKSGQQPVQLYKKSEATTDTTATTTYNVNLTINGAVEGDVVMAGADTAQAVIQPTIIFKEGDNKVPAGNYIFVTAFSDIDYTREAVITVNGDTVETYFGMWTSETTIDADMNIVVTFPEPTPATADSINIHIVNPKWTDAVADEGWWQISGYNADSSYYASLSNVETTEVAGTYSIADMDLDFTFIYKIGATSVKIAVTNITVKAELVEDMYIFTSTIIGEDGNTYNLTFDPIDTKAIQGEDYDSPEDMEYTFAAADSMAWTMQSYQGIPYAILRAKDAKATAAISLNFMGDTIPAGIYPFGSTFEPGTADAGGVTSQGQVSPSFFGYLSANGNISVPLFYCTSGSAEVSYVDDMIKVEVNAINTWEKSGHFTFYVNAHKNIPVVLPEYTVDVNFVNAELYDYTKESQAFQIMGYSADSTQFGGLTIFSDKVEGTYNMATAMGSMAGGQYNFVVVNADSETEYSYLPIQSGTLTITKVTNDSCEYYQAVGTLVSDTTCINLTLTTAPKEPTAGDNDGDTIAIHLVEPELTDYTSEMGLWQISGYSEDERFAVGVCGMSESEIAGNYDMNSIVADYTYIYDMDTDTEYAPADFTGKVEIVDGYYVLTATLTAEDGTVFALTFDPIDPNAGNPYDMQEAIDYTFANADAEDWEIDEYQGVSYTVLGARNEKAAISISVNFMGDTIPAGIYTFGTTYEAGTADAGELDMNEGSVYPSFFSTLDEDGYLNVPLYLCTGGNVELTYVGDSIKVEVNATNTWGVDGHFTFFVDAHKESGDKPELMEVNTIANAIACADAKVLNDNDSVTVTGYISGMFLKPTNFTKYGSVSIWLTDSVNGTAHEFELYNCYGMNGDTLASWGPNFVEIGTSNIDVEYVIGHDGTEFKLGDKIVAKGKFKFYNGTYELNTGCYIVEGGAPTGITTLAAEKAVKDGKFLEKNEIVIVKNGKRYNVLGTPVK